MRQKVIKGSRWKENRRGVVDMKKCRVDDKDRNKHSSEAPEENVKKGMKKGGRSLCATEEVS